MKNISPTVKIIILILLACFLLLIRYFIIKYLYKNVSGNILRIFGIVALLAVLYNFYANYLRYQLRNSKIYSNDASSRDIILYTEILTYLNIIFLSVFSYMAINKDKNAWNVALYQTIVSLLGLGLLIKTTNK